jgi:hypothetical protein
MAEDDKTTTTDTAADGAASAEAAFGSGYDAGAEVLTDKSEGRGRNKPLVDLTKPPANGKAEPARDATRVDADPPPEVVQITAREWAAQLAKNTSYDQQLSKAFGTIGNLQKLVNGFQQQKAQDAPPAARKVELSPKAYAKMATDFPELAQQSREALQEALSELLPSMGANAAADPAKIESMLVQWAAKRELAVLNDRHPDWREIVGAVDLASGQQPPADNAYRIWLATKPAEYQQAINGSELADVIGRSIRLFQRETTDAPAKTNGTAQRDTARADRIRAAVQPRGDNAGNAPANTSEDAFAAGFGR